MRPIATHVLTPVTSIPVAIGRRFQKWGIHFCCKEMIVYASIRIPWQAGGATGRRRVVCLSVCLYVCACMCVGLSVDVGGVSSCGILGLHYTRECASCGIVSIQTAGRVYRFSGKCTRLIFCSNFVLRVRVIVSVTGSVSYLNENFVVFLAFVAQSVECRECYGRVYSARIPQLDTQLELWDSFDVWDVSSCGIRAGRRPPVG